MNWLMNGYLWKLEYVVLSDVTIGPEYLSKEFTGNVGSNVDECEE